MASPTPTPSGTKTFFLLNFLNVYILPMQALVVYLLHVGIVYVSIIIQLFFFNNRLKVKKNEFIEHL